MKIYLIATIRNIQSATEARNAGTYGIAEIEESRTVGYFLTLEEAKRVVKNNICDIHEDYYRYAMDAMTYDFSDMLESVENLRVMMNEANMVRIVGDNVNLTFNKRFFKTS